MLMRRSALPFASMSVLAVGAWVTTSLLQRSAVAGPPAHSISSSRATVHPGTIWISVPSGVTATLQAGAIDPTPSLLAGSGVLPKGDDDTGSAAQRRLGPNDYLVNVVLFTERPLNRAYFHKGRLRLRAQDVGPFEGAPAPGYARRWVIVAGQAAMVSAAFGHSPVTPADLRTANVLLGHVKLRR